MLASSDDRLLTADQTDRAADRNGSDADSKPPHVTIGGEVPSLRSRFRPRSTDTAVACLEDDDWNGPTRRSALGDFTELRYFRPQGPRVGH